MKRPDEIDKCRDNLRRPGYIDAGTCRITSEGLSEILDWIDHLEANQAQVIRADEVTTEHEVLVNGEWWSVREVGDEVVILSAAGTSMRHIRGRGFLFAARPKQTPEEIVRKVLEHPTPVAEQHAKKAAAYEIVSALQLAGLLTKQEES